MWTMTLPPDTVLELEGIIRVFAASIWLSKSSFSVEGSFVFLLSLFCLYDTVVRFNTEHFLLHAARDEAQKAEDEADQKKGFVRLPSSIIGYKPYTEWVYWLPNDPPTADQSQRCAGSFENRTSGPFVLPDGATICFVSDMCQGPFPGSSKFALSADGTTIEMGVPFAAFLRSKKSGLPMLGIGQSVAVQFSLETNAFSSWCSDATLSFSYTFEGAPESNAGGMAGLAIGMFFAGILVAALAVLVWFKVVRHKQSSYNTL